MTQKAKYWFLENFNLFQVLPEEKLMQMHEHIRDSDVKKNELVYLSEDESRKIYFLKQGKIKLTRFSEQGKEHIIGIIGPGEIFGESALLGSSTMDENAEVIEDAVICSIDYSQFRNFINENPELNLSIIKLIGLKFRRIQTKLDSLCFKNSEERIRQYIKSLAYDFGRQNQLTKDITLRISLTHEEIAKLTATTRQKVTSVLSNLVKQGIIEYRRNKIIIRDIEKL